MNLFNILEIIGRILHGLCVVGFVLGMFLHDKHSIFEKIWVGTGFIMLGYGFTQMFVYAILGC